MSLDHTLIADLRSSLCKRARGAFSGRGDRLGGGTDSGSRGGGRGRGGFGDGGGESRGVWRGRGGFSERGARGGFDTATRGSQGWRGRGGLVDRGSGNGQTWRGRGGFGTWTPQGSGPQVKPVSASPPPPFGDLIDTIDREDIEESPDRPCGITAATVVASYNWMNGPSPKIMIPGKPALWTPRKGSYQLRQDDGIYYRDPNAAAYSDHPMEAAVVSVMKMNPPSSHGRVDLFACGSTLGNLLRFVRGADHPFRMLAEVVGNTVHLVRRENSPKEQIIGIKGFGHVFPEENTTWEKDVMGSNSHQRIMRYQFDGLDMMVRFQGDGYVKLIDEEVYHSPAAAKAGPQSESSLLDGLQALKIQKEASPAPAQALQTVTGGQMVPQDAMFDIKTRSVNVKHRDTLGEELPRLWLAQIKQFILAHHTSGRFEDVEIQDVSEDIEAWEADNQVALRRFAQLLRRIIEERLREGPEVKVEIVRREGSDTLEILKRLPDAGTPFSDKTRLKWSNWLNGDRNGGADSEDESPERGGNDIGEYTDDDSEDFTACDENCGYCGRCATSLI